MAMVGIVLFVLGFSFLILFSMTPHGFVSELVQHRVEDSYTPCYTVLVPPDHQYVACKTAYGQDTFEPCSKDTYQPDNASSSLEVQCIHPSCSEHTRTIEVQDKGPKILKCVCDLFNGYCGNDIVHCHMIPKSCRGKWVYPDCSCKRKQPRLETPNTPTTVKEVVFWPADSSRFPIDPKVHTYKLTTAPSELYRDDSEDHGLGSSTVPTMDGSGGTKTGNTSDVPNPKVKSEDKSTEKSDTSRTVGIWIGYAILGCVTILACFVIAYCVCRDIWLKFQSALVFTRTNCFTIPNWICKSNNRRTDQAKQQHAEPDENRPLYATIEEVEKSPAVARESRVMEIVPVVTSEGEEDHPSPESDSSQTSVKAVAVGLDKTESSVNKIRKNSVNEYVDLPDSKSLDSYTEATAVRIEEDNTRCKLPVVPHDADLSSFTTRSADLRSRVVERRNASLFQTPVSTSAQNAQVTTAEIHRTLSTNSSAMSTSDGNSDVNNREKGDRDLFRSVWATSMEVNNASVLGESQQSDIRDVADRSVISHGSFYLSISCDGGRQHLQTRNILSLADATTFAVTNGRNASVIDVNESSVMTINAIGHDGNATRDYKRHLDSTSSVYYHSQSGSDGSEASGPSAEEPVLPLATYKTTSSCDEPRFEDGYIIPAKNVTKDMKQLFHKNNAIPVRIKVSDATERMGRPISPERIERRTPFNTANKPDCINNSGTSLLTGAAKGKEKPVATVRPQKSSDQIQSIEGRQTSQQVHADVRDVRENFDHNYDSFSSSIIHDSSTSS